MQSGKFLAKMVIVLTLVINGVFLHRTVLPKILGLHHQDWLWRNEKFSRVMNLSIPAGVVSFVSWWGTLLLGAAGRQPWTLTQVLSIYFGIIVLGIISAIFAPGAAPDARRLDATLRAARSSSA